MRIWFYTNMHYQTSPDSSEKAFYARRGLTIKYSSRHQLIDVSSHKHNRNQQDLEATQHSSQFMLN